MRSERAFVDGYEDRPLRREDRYEEMSQRVRLREEPVSRFHDEDYGFGEERRRPAEGDGRRMRRRRSEE